MPDFKNPDFKNEVRQRLARLNLEPTREAAILEEISQHLEQRFEELLAQGVPAEAARAAVLTELSESGRLEKELLQVEKQVRFEPALPPAASLRATLSRMERDLRYAFRALRLNPGFASVAILSLALGIGANTAIFQLLDAVRLRTLPVKNPQELALVKVSNSQGRSGDFHGSFPMFTNAIWERVRDGQQVFSGMAAWSSTSFNLAAGGRSRLARGMYVNGDFFNTLGIQPVTGRVFSPADDHSGCGLPGTVISYAFWQKEFGGKPDAVGSKLTIDGHPVEVIGVTGPGFYGIEVGRGYDMAIPICSEAVIDGEFQVVNRVDGWWLAFLGRLKPGWTPAKATAQLESISPSVFQATLPPKYQSELAKQFLGWKLAAEPASSGLSSLRKNYEDPLWILLAIAGIVLLIACANLANLMLARANAREREIAVRLALGASRFRLMQQLMMESLLLSGIGALTGILLAQVLTRVLVSFLTTQFRSVTLDLGLDWRVLGFTAAAAILTCLLFGLMPAVKATATPPIVAMKTGSRGVTAGRERFSLRRVLVVAQVAMSMVLLVGAFLFVRSFQNLVNLDAGFRQSGLLTAELDFTPMNVPPGERNRFKEEMIERMRALPGVESAASASVLPMSGSGWNDTVHTDASGQEVREVAYFDRVSPGFFKTMETPFIQGRDFSSQDIAGAPAVAIVNESFVRKFMKEKMPLGATFRVDEGAGVPESVYQVVGVVADSKYRDIREDFFPVAYVASQQDKKPDTNLPIVLRSSLTLDALTSSVERSVAEVNPAIGIQFSVMKTQVRDTLQRERLMASLSGFFGFLAAILATIGLYGVISYMVVRRRNEIGIRMALGADRRNVLALVMREAAALLAVGLVIGAGLSLLATRSASALLFGLKPHDPMTMAMAAISLAAVAAAASYLPAFRAARIHPTEALREE
jgi:putative ABC transport system permease protein